MKIINRIVAASALAFAAIVPLTLHAQAAAQACLDSNVKAHAEVLALHMKAASRPAANPNISKEAYDRGIGWLSAAIFEHTKAQRTANLTAAQCAQMTTYIENIRTNVNAAIQGQLIGPMTTAGNTPPPSAITPTVSAADAAAAAARDLARTQFETASKGVDSYLADARAKQELTAFDESEIAAMKKKLADRILAEAKAVTQPDVNYVARYNSWRDEQISIQRVLALMGNKTNTPDASGLDHIYYAYKYPDVRQAMGLDKDKIANHWTTFGQKEARWPNKQTELLNAPAPRSGHLQSIMRLGDVLRSGEYMRSNNGQYILALQPDANLVIYQTSDPSGASGNNRRWYMNSRSFEVGTQYKYYMRLQADGHACVYRGSSEADQGQGINCAPYGAGGPVGRYFLALQDDGNLAIYKGGGPADNRGWIWDRITTKPSSGFNFAAALESIGHRIADTTVYAANSLANVTVRAANTIAANTVMVAGSAYTWAKEEGPAFLAGAQSALKTVQDNSKKALNVVGERTLDAGMTVGNTISTGAQGATRELLVNGRVVGRVLEQGGKIVATQVVAGSDAVDFAVATYVPGGKYIVEGKDIVGREIIVGTQVVGKEIIKAGVIVGHAVVEGTEYVVEAGKFILNAVNNCSALGKLIPAATNLIPNKEAAVGLACYGQVYAGFLCEIPKIFGQVSAIPVAAEQILAQSVTAECAPTYAFVPFYPGAPLVCGMGKIVVEDAVKVIQCSISAERNGVFSRFFSTSSGGAIAWPTIPSESACTGLGKVAYMVAETVLTKKVGAEIKALSAAGKLTTGARVAEQVLAFKSLSGNVASFNKLTEMLNTLPECK